MNINGFNPLQYSSYRSHCVRGGKPILRLLARSCERSAAAIHPDSSQSGGSQHTDGERRCFPAERPGRGVGLWHAEQPMAYRGRVSFTIQAKNIRPEHTHRLIDRLIRVAWSQCCQVMSLPPAPSCSSTPCPRAHLCIATSQREDDDILSVCATRRSRWIFGLTQAELILHCTSPLVLFICAICRTVRGFHIQH